MSLFKSKNQGLVITIWPDRSKEDAAAVETFSTSMKDQGYEIRDAVSTPQGIALIAGSKPDLVYVHADPSTVATLMEDMNFSKHYRLKLAPTLHQAVLFERKD